MGEYEATRDVGDVDARTLVKSGLMACTVGAAHPAQVRSGRGLHVLIVEPRKKQVGDRNTRKK